MSEEECSLCEEFWKALEEVEKEEMPESESVGEEKRKREPLCVTLPPELHSEISEMSKVLGIDKSKIVELALTCGDEVISMLRKATKAVKKIEEHRVLGEEWPGEEYKKEEEGGEV